jgi:hypothetical protein
LPDVRLSVGLVGFKIVADLFFYICVWWISTYISIEGFPDDMRFVLASGMAIIENQPAIKSLIQITVVMIIIFPGDFNALRNSTIDNMFIRQNLNKELK